jgi:glycosyltransferase involved in cell wall biosynthesis
MIEAILLRQADRLLLASPQFYSKHYAGKIDSNKVVVVENYLATDMRLDYVDPPSPLTPFKIAYAGIFRSTKVLQLIAAAAAQLGDQVEFNLYGYPDTQLDKTVIARCGSLSNVHIHGEFEHAELPRICQRNHILLGFLDPDADLNEQWLLPNRIYHAGAFQRPVVVNEGTYTAKIVLERKLGLLCAFSVSATVEMIRRLSEHGGRLYFEIQKQIPTSGEYFLQGHYARILDEIAG